MRRAKIICTLGPSSSSEEMIEQLILAGMDVARLNFSHGTHAFYRSLINRVRSISVALGHPVAILQDLQGPKIRTRSMLGGSITLESGKQTLITTEDIVGTPERFATQYKLLPQDVKPGDSILLDDGKIVLKCVEILPNQDVLVDIIHGGKLSNSKGINLPNGGSAVPCLTDKDIQDLHFGAQVEVDAVALSFVRTAEDIRILRRELAACKSRPWVMAKIEKPQAIENLDEILEEADGVMVARGDLGVETPLEMVPIAQKKIVQAAIMRGKTVAVATQMLESMISAPRPTRAEASDVANAVLDGADMLMLSAESASGEFPIESVKTMVRIIRHAEGSELTEYFRTHEGLVTHSKQRFQNAISLAAVRVSQELKASAIVIYTTSGNTARLLADYRPQTPIIAYVPNLQEQRRLCFTWGVEAEIMPRPENTEALLQSLNDKLVQSQRFAPGETVVVLLKVPLVPSQRTNTLHVHTLTRPKIA